jgi:hypothetical protein
MACPDAGTRKLTRWARPRRADRRHRRCIEQRCVRDVGYRVIAGGLHPDHATIARFRASP